MRALYRNHMGNDLDIVNDARISFDASSSAIGWIHDGLPNDMVDQGYDNRFSIPSLNKQDRNLIQFLARGCRTRDWDALLTRAMVCDTGIEADALLKHVKKMATHWTPFAHQVIKLRMKAPVPIRTQCFKSKMGFVENEESRRYIDCTPELFVPEFRERPDGSIKQGSGGLHPLNGEWQAQYIAQCESAIQLYENMIRGRIAPEQARFVLPQGVYVNWVWTGSLYAFAEFANKRSDRGHAQGEIADLANAIDPIMRRLYPVAWPALTE